jgi:hypothetical protein
MKATAWRTLGALAGAVGGVALGFGITKGFGSGFLLGLLALLGLIVLSVVLYLVARTQTTPGKPAGEFMPGLLLGVNTAVNGVLLATIFGPVAIVICVIPALAVIEPVARSDIYQAFLGWGNVLLPMSWPIVGLGLLFLLVSGILALINLAIHSSFLKIEKLKLSAKTGTAFLVGGLAGNGNLSSGSTGYNMGNIAFLTSGKATDAYLVEHESGHTLNLGIWGAIVHLIGALDENVFGGGAGAYTELLAESNVPPSSRQHTKVFPMWGDLIAAPATAPTPLATPA